MLTRLDGSTLLQLLLTRAMTPRQVGAILATLADDRSQDAPAGGRCTPCTTGCATRCAAPETEFRSKIATGILTLIERLPPWDGLCHCDLHPGNVIMTADGPRLVDWVGVVRAPAALDLSVCQVQLSEIVPEFADDPDRPRAVNAAMQSEYARLADMSQAALTAAMEPFLPIVCVFALVGDAWPAKREWLIQRVEAALHLENQ